ncbi:MAG TPA: M56 family metallopeptidase [Chitinophagaceae bacterium]|jgi:hypothetical protein|nr:M56 family metallopeptidase [Chitinophagaceae bacterium]
MNALISYILQATVVSGILYTYYHFFLRNKRFHQYNRFYLLAATLLSLLLPFVTIPVHFNSAEEVPAVYQVLSLVQVGGKSTTTIADKNSFSWNFLLCCLYGLIAVFALIRFAIALYKIRRLTMRYPSEKIDDISFINTNEAGTPYSFFRLLFWDAALPLNTDRGQQVFRHELYHIRQRHSFDIVAMELLTVICWINPFFHLIKKEIKAIHEFLADKHAMEQSDKWDYAELLLQKAFQTQHSLVNPFFHNQIKRRIAMITTSSKTSYQYLRKLMVLPLACIVVSLISVSCQADKSDVKTKETTATELDKIVVEEQKEQPAPPPPPGGNKDVLGEVREEPIVEITQQSAIIDGKRELLKVEDEASFPGGVEAWRQFLQKNLKANVPVDNGAPEGKYSVMAMLLIDKDGAIKDIQMLSKMGYGMENEVKRVMQASPNWIPAKIKGKSVRSFKKQPVTFVVSAE